MKIFGHPVHMMLVHFPSALFPVSVVCSAADYYTMKLSYNNVAFYTLAAGVAMGWLAAITGFFDLIPVTENKPSAAKKALLHGCINTFVLIVFSLLLYKANKSHPALTIDSITLLCIKAALVAIMIAGNFIGGSLILKDRVNMQN